MDAKSKNILSMMQSQSPRMVNGTKQAWDRQIHMLRCKRARLDEVRWRCMKGEHERRVWAGGYG